jgi:hypothetical protein
MTGMIKLSVLIIASTGYFFPLLGQIDHDYNTNDRVPIVNTYITKEQVPAAVLKSLDIQFDKDKPQTWSKFPFALKEYGWVYDVGSSDLALNRFEVTLKTKEGDDLWAVYSASGDLIETKEVSKNTVVPAYVMDALARSEYKDWQIVGDKEIIKYYHDHDITKAEQHLRLTLEKDNVKRSVSFNYNVSK